MLQQVEADSLIFVKRAEPSAPGTGVCPELHLELSKQRCTTTNALCCICIFQAPVPCRLVITIAQTPPGATLAMFPALNSAPGLDSEPQSSFIRPPVQHLCGSPLSSSFPVNQMN